MSSRSDREFNIANFTTTNPKIQDKRNANRRLPRINKVLLSLTHDEPAWRARRSVSNMWTMVKDGKIRFDPARFPARLRK